MSQIVNLQRVSMSSKATQLRSGAVGRVRLWLQSRFWGLLTVILGSAIWHQDGIRASVCRAFTTRSQVQQLVTLVRRTGRALGGNTIAVYREPSIRNWAKIVLPSDALKNARLDRL